MARRKQAHILSGCVKELKERKQKSLLESIKKADEAALEIEISKDDGMLATRREISVKVDKEAKADLDTLLNIGGQDLTGWAIHLLKTEWAIKYSSLSIWDYLTKVRGLSRSQYRKVMAAAPKEEWNAQRESLLDTITSDLVRRQVDLIAEHQEKHISGSNIALARAVEMLSRGHIEIVKTDKDGNTKKTTIPLRSSDILNLSSAIEKAQMIYRRAMGLPNDEGGLAQILEKIDQMRMVQNNLQINIMQQQSDKKESPVDKFAANLTYDQILEFINYRRERRKEQQKKDERLDNSFNKMGGESVPEGQG